MLSRYRQRELENARKKNESENFLLSSHDDSSKAELEKFETYYDDSSDEEEIEDKLTHYDINQNWLSLKKTLYKANDRCNNDMLLSFVVHATGLKVLYLNEVNKEYYLLKQNSFTAINQDKPLNQLHNLVKKGILLSLSKTLLSITKFIDNAAIDKPENIPITIISKKIQQDFSLAIDEIINTQHAIYIAELKRNRFYSLPNRENYLSKIYLFFVNSLIDQFFEAYPSKLTNTNRKEIKHEVFVLAKIKITDILNKLKIAKKYNSDGREAALIILNNYKGIYSHLVEHIIKLLADCQASGYVENMILRQIEEENVKNEVIESFLEDLTIIYHSTGTSHSLTQQESKVYREYFSISQESLTDEIEYHMLANLKLTLTNALHAFSRPTLGKNHLFISSNSYSFYANIRLSNRSQKRQILNLQNAFYKQDACARIWRLCPTLTNNEDVVESQQIIGASLGRKDMVEELGNYEKVSDFILQVKSYFNHQSISINDANIANWLRVLFKGNTPTFQFSSIDNSILIHKLQSIVYLLFGCEATRNPAMIVINQMMLDLIIEKPEQWNFSIFFNAENTIDPTLMPMVPKGAVSVARALESDYRKYLPYPYYYRGIEDNTLASQKKLTVKINSNKFSKKNLIQLEAKIVNEWLQLKEFTLTKLPQNILAEKIGNFIESQFNDWFGSIKDTVEDEVINEKFSKIKI